MAEALAISGSTGATTVGGGWGFISQDVATFNHVAPLVFLSATTRVSWYSHLFEFGVMLSTFDL